MRSAGSPISGGLHHVEIWVPDLATAQRSWGWLLGELGWTPDGRWPRGQSWRHGPTYLVLEQSRSLTSPVHDRLGAGLNHVAFHVGPRAAVDRLVARAPEHEWSLVFPERHPYAGGSSTYAAYLEDGYGYEVELVATPADPVPVPVGD